MSQKTSAAAIGAFVLGAIVLIVVALLAFGSGQFLKDTETYTLYFQGNANGLNIGAPVSFRGVKIGTVKQITLISDLSTDEVFVEVVIVVLPDTFRDVQSQPGVDKSAGKDLLKYLIEDRGLRAKLAMSSLLTGQLYIEFDHYPHTSMKLLGFDSQHPELPTLPSEMEELRAGLRRLLQKAQTLPIEKLTEELVKISQGINTIISSRNFQNTPELLNQTLVKVRDLTAKLNEQVMPLADGLMQTSEQAAATLTDISKLLKNKQGQVVNLAESLERTAAQATATLSQTDKVISGIDDLDLSALIQKLSEAARSIDELASYLERHPEALLRGKH